MSGAARTSPLARLRGGLGSTAGVYLVLLGVIVVAAAVVAAAGRTLFTPGNLTVLMTSIAVLGFVAIGQTLVILVGSLDLSVAYLVSLSSVLAAGTMAGASGGTVPGIVTALVATVVIGALTGCLVAYLQLSGFIASLGVGLLVAGYLASFYRGTTGKASPELAAFGSASIGPLPVPTLLMLACLVLAVVLVGRTRMGMHLLAVGGDAHVARMSGVRAGTPVVVAHALSGLCAGIAGVVIVARLGVGSPTVGEQGGYDLLSIAAVVLGGASLAGGRGSLWGTLGGILIFAVADSAMGILQVNPFLKEVVRGVVIIAAVALYARRTAPIVRRRFAASAGPDPAEASAATAAGPTAPVTEGAER